MADRPILFSAPMVRALLDGRKTQTRRVLKPQPNARDFRCTTPETARWFHDPVRGGMWIADGVTVGPFKSPSPGDRLWVREAWDFLPCGQPGKKDNCDIVYWATGSNEKRSAPLEFNPMLYGKEKIRPSIHMPRWASRLTLTITDVRVERLQDISGRDAVAEGVQSRLPDNGIAQQEYADLWDSINGPGAWHANPWVVAVSFTVAHNNIDAGVAA